MRVVKKVPKSAKCFSDNKDDKIGFYGTRKCIYLVFNFTHKLVEGKLVEVPVKRTILRLSPEEFEEFFGALSDWFAYIQLTEGKYIKDYIV